MILKPRGLRFFHISFGAIQMKDDQPIQQGTVNDATGEVYYVSHE